MTLIEVMIAITLSLLLLGGLMQMVVGNKQTYRVQDAMARVQENGRYSMHFLTKEIRMAGFSGCSNISGGLDVTNNVDPAGGGNNYNVNKDAAVDTYDGTSAILGYTYTTGALPADIAAMGMVAGTAEGNVMDNTDMLFIRRASSCPGATVTSHNTANARFAIASNANCQIQQADIVMVTNCETADLFGVSNAPSQTGAANIAHGANYNDAPQLDNPYGGDSFILKMQAMVFYIGVGASGEPALFKRELTLGNMVSSELVEGVEDMTILYGVDTDTNGTADIYMTATAIAAAIAADPATTQNMENVVSLRVTVGTRTLEDNIATSTNNGDRRIRRDFTTTVGIRNRIS